MQYYRRATMEFCIYKWMLNGKYTDFPVMNRWTSLMVVAVQSKHPWKELSSSFEIHAMENYLRGLLSEVGDRHVQKIKHSSQ